MPELTPLNDNRQEHFLNGEDLEPITRREHFYAGRESELPEGHQEPETREEWFIKKYRGGGGGDITVESLSVTSNGTYTAPSGKAYSPVEVNVPLPQNAYLLKSVNTPTPIASFSDGDEMVMPSLKVAIEPQQDLHGYDSPWVGGAGKNKLPINCDTQTKQGVSYTVYKNEDGTVTRIHAQGTATAGHSFSVVEGYNVSNPFMIKAGSYWFKGISNGESGKIDFNIRKQGESSDLVQITDKKSLELSEDTYFQSCYLYVYNGTVVNTDIYPMVWLKSSPNDDFAPYSNICPISGWDEVDVTVADDVENPTVSNVYTIDLDGTRYGGEVDVVNGIITPAPYYASYNGEALTGEWISDRDKYEVGATPTIGAQVVNIGASGTPVSILPTAIKSLRGVNNVYANTGNITDAEYFSKEV